MSIRSFEWFGFDTVDDDVLLNYCSSKKDIFLCWWLSGDVQNDDESIDELLVLALSTDNDMFWRGGSYDVHFLVESVEITHLRTQETNAYKNSELIAVLKEWKEVTQ